MIGRYREAVSPNSQGSTRSGAPLEFCPYVYGTPKAFYALAHLIPDIPLIKLDFVLAKQPS